MCCAGVRACLYDELDRAGAYIVHGPGGGHRRFAHLLAQRRRHAGCRGFFQHLLVAALHRTVSLMQVDVVALGVAKHLDFNVARALQVLFDQHRIVAKAVARLALAAGQRGGKVLRLVNRTHALATAAGAGLDQHGIADAVGLALQQRRVLVGTVVAGHQRHAGGGHQLLGLSLQAHGANGGR